MKPLRNLKNINSPTDSETQTAIASKDNGIFLTKALLCQKLQVSQTPTHFSITRFTHDGVCLVCVCVCMYVSLYAWTNAALLTLHT